MTGARYIIHETTMYIRPVIIDDCIYSEVKEYEQPVFIINHQPLELIEQSCYFYNTTYSARKEKTRIVADICQKPPIVLKPETGTYFFPSHSDRVKEMHWFNLDMIKYYRKGKYNDTEICFDDGSVIAVPTSYYIINTQFLHAVKLEYCLRTKAQKKVEMMRREAEMRQTYTNIYELLAMYALLERQV
ncbi:competence protein ComK [Macrococcus equipercicus]|nr:competence protein ComK [Macrococcus equipercicus]